MARTRQTKRLRLTSDTPKVVEKSKPSIFEKVLCQQDYVSIICSFLRIADIYGSISLISVFHWNLTNNIRQSKLIHQCISYDVCNSYLNLLNVKLKFLTDNNLNNNSDNDESSSDDNDNDNDIIVNAKKSVCQQLYPLLNDWESVIDVALMSPNLNIDKKKIINQDFEEINAYNIQLACELGNFKTLKYWMLRVKCI